MAASLPQTQAIRTRFNFETPDSYRALEARNLFEFTKKTRDMDLTKPGNHYLYFGDMEWYQPKDLLKFEFQNYHLPGFVPFAHAANGDFWCWYPKLADK